MNRRDFLKAALLSPFVFPLLGQQGWAYRNANEDFGAQKLIVVLLRGGIDGLNVVAPYGDNRYKQIRPTIAMSRSSGLLDLDGYWGMHPSLAPLSPLWANHSLAFVHACGSPDKTRSHFDAQDYMESGVPGQKATSTGWMNRLVGQLPSKNSALQAISIGPVLPRIFAGPSSIATIAKSGNSGGKGGGKAGKRMGRHMQSQANGNVPSVFTAMYGGRNDDMSKAFASGKSARSKVDAIMTEAAAEPQEEMAAMTKEQIIANRGALTPKSSPEFGKQLATLFTKDPTVQVAFIDFGGWDTHVREGAEQGQLANLLQPLAGGLADLVRGLGAVYNNTTIVVMSEFGRTARENGNGGTDHGHGNAMWLMGGGVPGGKVYGRFGGLADNQLNEARDLPTSTDFRAVISSVVSSRLGLSAKQMAVVFPGYQFTGNPFIQG
ncbi:MAG: hypothetical protein C0508_05390 [Cyanobacteria bacterium PR.023]|jgi:uncharacterized protein (DUF1501 family)|nr:hypothetical protein [Cyanobacteria bacterium PR.023]